MYSVKQLKSHHQFLQHAISLAQQHLRIAVFKDVTDAFTNSLVFLESQTCRLLPHS